MSRFDYDADPSQLDLERLYWRECNIHYEACRLALTAE
jgi:hypothetical protein